MNIKNGVWTGGLHAKNSRRGIIITAHHAPSAAVWCISSSILDRFRRIRYVFIATIYAVYGYVFCLEWIGALVILQCDCLPQQETLTMTLASSLFRYSCRYVLSALLQSLFDYFLRSFVSYISFVLDEYNRGDLWLQSVGLRFVFMSLLDDVVTLFVTRIGSYNNALLRFFSSVLWLWNDVSFVYGTSFRFESCVVKSSVWYLGGILLRIFNPLSLLHSSWYHKCLLSSLFFFLLPL